MGSGHRGFVEIVQLSDSDPAIALSRLRQVQVVLGDVSAAVAFAIAALEGTASQPETASTLLTVTEAATELRISKSTVFALLKSGELTGIKLGRDRCVHRASIAALLDRRGAA